MSGLDGALLDEMTAGINSPSNGQQGYVAFADSQTPYPNLEYVSLQTAGQRLKLPIAQAAESTSVEPATIAASGSHVITHVFPSTPYTVYEFVVRSQVKVGTAMTWFARTRYLIWTGSAGTQTGANATAELVAGSGFTLTPSSSGNTLTLTVTSSTGSIGNIFSSITEVYRHTTL